MSRIACAPRPALSVVIVAFHRPHQLAASLRRFEHADIERVVVNVEDDPDIARTASECTVIADRANRGYAAAVNAGARAAHAPVIVFMNDDAEIDAVNALRLGAAVASGETDVAVPRVVDDAGRSLPTVAAVPTPRSLAREWMLLPDHPVVGFGRRATVEKWRTPDVVEPIEAAAAVVVATRRDLLAAVPLPEDYFLYWEESEWFWNLRARGVRVQYRPEACCRHAGGRDDVRAEKSRLLARNAVRCIRRTQGRRAALAAYLVVIAWNARLLFADSVRLVTRPRRHRRGRVRARAAGLRSAVGSLGEAW